MSHWMDEFESLGQNCEFGFVQQALGVQASSLLRWTFLDSVPQTAAGVRSGFTGVFAFENLVPYGDGTMVHDVTAGIAFHTDMVSVPDGERWAFVADEAERRAIHQREAQKFVHLREKFECGLTEESRIYVAKRNAGLTDSDAQALHAAIRSRGRGRLLVVCATKEPRRVGQTERLRPGLARGWVSRFAPIPAAYDLCLPDWEALLRGAAAVL